MDAAKLRAWWWHKQGLDGSLEGASPADVLARTGWARSVGGVGPYLTLYARAGVSRLAADAALAGLEIHELPAARGCTYVLPASDYALGLKVGEAFSSGETKVAGKLGVTGAEIDKLRAAILRALEKGPLDPDGLREAVGAAVRSLGPEGVKKGLASTLPVALGPMQSAGLIRRIPTSGRLDQQRYRYALWNPNPLASFALSAGEAHVELARRFFSWIGPASAAEFQWFSGLGVKGARAALEPLELVPLGDEGNRLLAPQERARFEAFEVPARPRYALVSSLDGLVSLRRDLGSLVDAADRDRLSSLQDLPSHAIVDRGRVVGLWEYDPESSSIAWKAFVKPDRALRLAVERTEAYVREQLGDARSFSLDSPKSRAPRIQALRERA